MERPYFRMGTATAPVYQWRWSSQGGAVAGLARGLERFDPLAGGGTVGAQAVYDHGEWRVVLARALATADTGHELSGRTGPALPVAFFAWEGSQGEEGTAMGGRAWDFISLDEHT